MHSRQDPPVIHRPAPARRPTLYSNPPREAEEAPGDKVIAFDTCLMQNYVAASSVEADAFECIDVGAGKPVMFLLNSKDGSNSNVDVLLVPPDPQSRTGYGPAIWKQHFNAPVVATTSAWSVETGEAVFVALVGPLMATDGFKYRFYVSVRAPREAGDKITDAPLTEADYWTTIYGAHGIGAAPGTVTGLAAGYDESGALWIGVTIAQKSLEVFCSPPGVPHTQWNHVGSFLMIKGSYGDTPIRVPAPGHSMCSLSAVTHHGEVVFATQGLSQVDDDLRWVIGVLSCAYDPDRGRYETSQWIALNTTDMVVPSTIGWLSNLTLPISLYIDEDGGLCAAFYAEVVLFGYGAWSAPIVETRLYDSEGTAADSESSAAWRTRFLGGFPNDLLWRSEVDAEELHVLMSQSGVASMLLRGSMSVDGGGAQEFCFGAQTTGPLQVYEGGNLGSMDAVSLVPAAPRQRIPRQISAVPLGLSSEDAATRGVGRGGCGVAPMFMTLAPHTVIPLASLAYDPSTTDWLTSAVAVDTSAIDADAPAQEVMTWSIQLTALDENGQPALLTRDGTSALGARDSGSLLEIRAWEMIDVRINGIAVSLPANEWVPVPVTGTLATITVPTLALSGPTIEVCTTDGRVTRDDPVVIYCSNSVGNKLRETEAGDLETPRDMYGAPMLDEQGNPAPILPPETNSPENCEAVASALQGCGDLAQGAHRETTGWGRRMDRRELSSDPDRMLCAAALRANPSRPVHFHMRFDRSDTSGAPGTAVRASYRALDASEAAALRDKLLAAHAPLDLGQLRARMGIGPQGLIKRLKRGWGDVTRAVKQEFVEIEEMVVSVVEGGVKVVLSLVDAVESAVAFVYDATLSLVEQVLDVAEMIFSAVKVGFEELTRWLAWIFSWEDIERSATVFQLIVGDTWGGLLASEDAVAREVDAFLREKQAAFNAYCDEFKAGGPNGTGIGAKTLAELAGVDDPRDTRPPLQSSAETGGHNIVMDAFTSDPNEVTFTGDDALPLQLDPDAADAEAQRQASSEAVERLGELEPDAEQRYGDYATELQGDPQAGLLQTTVGELLDPMQQMINELFTTVEDATSELFSQAKGATVAFGSVATSPIRVPLLAQILKLLGWRTDISPLDVMSLAVAVPFTATYKILSGGEAPFPDEESVEAFASWLETTATMKAVAREQRPTRIFLAHDEREAPVDLTPDDCEGWVGQRLLEGVARLRPDREPVRVSTRATSHSQAYVLKAKRIGLICRAAVHGASAVLTITLSALSFSSREASLGLAFCMTPAEPGVIPIGVSPAPGRGPGRVTKPVRSLRELYDSTSFTPEEVQDFVNGGSNLGGKYGTFSSGDSVAPAPKELRNSWVMLAKWCSMLLEMGTLGMRCPQFDIPLVNPASHSGASAWVAWSMELSFMTLPDLGNMVIYDKKTTSVLPYGPVYGSLFGAMALGFSVWRSVETVAWTPDGEPFAQQKNMIAGLTWAGNILSKVKLVLGFLNYPSVYLMLRVPLENQPGFELVIAPLGVAIYCLLNSAAAVFMVVDDGLLIYELDQIIDFLDENPPAASIWAIGGTNSAGELQSTEHLLGPADGKWTVGPSLHGSRQAMAAVSLAGTLYAIGGSHSGGDLTTVEVLTPPHQSGKPMPAWSSSKIAPLPVGLSGAAAVGMAGTKLVVVGGQTGGKASAKVYIYDLEAPNDGWQSGPPLAHARSYCGLAVLVDALRQPQRLFVAGGVQGSGGTVLDSVEVLDLNDMQRGWQPGPSLPEPRRDLSLSCQGSKLLAIGGRNANGRLDKVTVLAAGASEPRWVDTQPLPAPRSGHGAAILGSKLYVAGGLVGDPGQPSASCLVTDLSAEHTEWTTERSMSSARELLGVVKGFPGTWKLPS